MKYRNNVSRNGSGYYDGVAARAVRNADRAAKQNEGRTDEEIRFKKLLGTLFNVCELSGFSIESRMVIRDKVTGKIWD